jgi:hypothetical protein
MRLRAVLALIVVAIPAVGTRPVNAADNRPVTAVVFGDSFASGEGLPGVDPGESECQRALGRNSNHGSPSTAWGVSVLNRLSIPTAWFSACTGAVSDNFTGSPQDTSLFGLNSVRRDKTQLAEAIDGTGSRTFDVVLASFGGNDLGFDKAILDCIGLDEVAVGAAAGGSFGGWQGTLAGAAAGGLAGRCRPGMDGDVRAKVDSVLVPNLRKLYDGFAGATNPGGLVVVAGYPQLFEDPDGSWAEVNAVTRRCQGVRMDDARMLRGLTARVNQAIGAEVKAAGERHPDRTWVFADVSFTFTGHGLCSDHGDQWINGLTSGLIGGDFRLARSFHPTQEGHNAYADFIAGNPSDPSEHGINKVVGWRAPVTPAGPGVPPITSGGVLPSLPGDRDTAERVLQILRAAGFDFGHDEFTSCRAILVYGGSLESGDLDVAVSLGGGACGGDAAAEISQIRNRTVVRTESFCGDCDNEDFETSDYAEIERPYRGHPTLEILLATDGRDWMLGSYKVNG